MLCRELVAAWIVGAGIWLIGMGGLIAASDPTDDQAAQVETDGTSSYFLPAGGWSTYQDPSGRYTVVHRSLRPVLVD